LKIFKGVSLLRKYAVEMGTGNLSQRIMAICRLLTAFNLILGAVALGGMLWTASIVHTLAGESVPQLSRAGEMKSMSKDQQTAILLHLSAFDIDEMTKQTEAVKKANAELAQMISSYPASSAVTRTQLSQLANTQAQFMKSWDDIRQLSETGQKLTAWDSYNKEMLPLVEARDKTEDALADQAKHLATQNATIAMVAVGCGPVLVCVVVACSLLFGFRFTAMFSKSVTGSITPLHDAMERLGKGDLTGRLEIKSQDELGEMSSMLNNSLDLLEETLQRIHNRDSLHVGELAAAVPRRCAKLHAPACSHGRDESHGARDQQQRHLDGIGRTALQRDGSAGSRGRARDGLQDWAGFRGHAGDVGWRGQAHLALRRDRHDGQAD